MNVWANTWGLVSTWGASWGAGAPEPDVAVIDGAGIRRRRHTPAKARDRLPEDIRREQLEDERYLAELETKARPQVATDIPRTAMAAAVEPAVAPQLPDAIARAVSAEQVIARARASSAEVLAKAKTDERRRTALLLLMLD